jgi:chorismate mutase
MIALTQQNRLPELFNVPRIGNNCRFLSKSIHQTANRRQHYGKIMGKFKAQSAAISMPRIIVDRAPTSSGATGAGVS